MWPNPQFPVVLVTFTEDIRIGKLHFLCSECFLLRRIRTIRTTNKNWFSTNTTQQNPRKNKQNSTIKISQFKSQRTESITRTAI